ncbi:hypothetical protein B0T19DRAFT_81700 [Cercophora scortea]|uniref:Uncharacterized protein n=1 Tax=Cercophora scortea TaxID=314031 RepID=A0AAE0MMA5_9PEZI|nr:hypothetical protein B0T19DRAFT_81700 [Cercophora scortea]
MGREIGLLSHHVVFLAVRDTKLMDFRSRTAPLLLVPRMPLLPPLSAHASCTCESDWLPFGSRSPPRWQLSVDSNVCCFFGCFKWDMQSRVVITANGFGAGDCRRYGLCRGLSTPSLHYKHLLVISGRCNLFRPPHDQPSWCGNSRSVLPTCVACTVPGLLIVSPFSLPSISSLARPNHAPGCSPTVLQTGVPVLACRLEKHPVAVFNNPPSLLSAVHILLERGSNSSARSTSTHYRGSSPRSKRCPNIPAATCYTGLPMSPTGSSRVRVSSCNCGPFCPDSLCNPSPCVK